MLLHLQMWQLPSMTHRTHLWQSFFLIQTIKKLNIIAQTVRNQDIMKCLKKERNKDRIDWNIF